MISDKIRDDVLRVYLPGPPDYGLQVPPKSMDACRKLGSSAEIPAVGR